jgi:hypothetical protein
MRYIGQTGRTFKVRYKEHIQAIRNNNGNFGYSNHILNTGYTYGTIRYYGCHKKWEEGQAFKYLRKI